MYSSKKISIFSLLAIVFFSGCGVSEPENNIQQAPKNTSGEEVLTFSPCEDFIDYSKNLSKTELTDALKEVRNTKNLSLLHKYFCAENRAFRAYIGENKNNTEEIQWILSNDNDEVVRSYLASNRNLSERVAKKLVNDSSPVLYALARNPSVSGEVLKSILNLPPSAHIQESLAYNKNTSEELQLELAKRVGDIKVLTTLAKNKNLSKKAREELLLRNIPAINEILENQ